jgi:S1-C subfamily serine protease
MKEGDFIISMNEHRITSVDDLHHFLAEWPIGRPVTLTLLRGQEEIKIDVIPEEASSG